MPAHRSVRRAGPLSCDMGQSWIAASMVRRRDWLMFSDVALCPIRAKTGHDHEAACSPAPGTAPFTPPVALSMIVKAFIPEAGTRSFTIMDEPLRCEACVAGESGAAIVAT